MTNLILGYGRLGKELVAQTQWHYIARSIDGFDFCNIKSYSYLLDDYQTIINCIADTNTYSNDRQNHLNVNFKAVCDLVDYCNITNKKLCQISTDYVYANSVENASEEDIPVHARTWYTYSKLLADGYIQARSKDYLIIVCSFKQNPWPYLKAPARTGNFDYTEKIAQLIIKLINKGASGIFNVGTKPKRLYDLAKESNPDVVLDTNTDPNMPQNVIMNLSKMKEFLNE
jgi:dTDP-4-dehydrorhamnose reductase